MSLAGRLAQYGQARGSTGRAAPVRAARPPGAAREGFAHAVMEVAVARGGARPAELAEDLAALELPTAPALARALATLAVGPREGLDAECPAVMFDLETTGLMGQPSTVVGVAAAAWHVAPDRLRVEQWSLGQLGAEGDMLVHLEGVLRSHVGPRCALVTFNGASFDVPLLRRRLVRHGIVRPTDDPLRMPHVDLVVPARRLWRDRGPDCRLGTLERDHLRLGRRGDVSGAEVVELLWRWLERPDAESAADLARVQRHNRLDVISLAALAHTMHGRMRRPVDAVERLRAARHHQRLGRSALALELLQPLLVALARVAARRRGSALEVEAGMLAADIDRRAGRRGEAARHWARVCRAVPGHAEAHEALAKHLEHRARQPGAALAVAGASDSPCARRLIRLRGKLAEGAEIPSLPQVIDAWADPRV